MKNLFYLVLVTFLFSCQKEEKVIINCDDETQHSNCLNEEIILDDSTEVTIFGVGTNENGFVKGLKLNEEWEASVSSFIVDRFFDTTNFILRFETFSNSGFIRESINISGIPRTIGCYSLETYSGFFRNDFPFVSYTLWTGDGDAFIGSYTLNPIHRDSNLIEIIEIDTLDKKVFGKLAASFVRTDTMLNHIHPNFIRLFNCEFEATYE